MYTTEQELVEAFSKQLLHDAPWKISTFETEFNYTRGKTDIIAISPDDEVIAIEAKLSKWRVALQQAYRNRCYADKSYVLLPYGVAQTASRYEYEFDRRGVGICSLLDNHIIVLKEALEDEPIQPWLRQLAIHYAVDG